MANSPSATAAVAMLSTWTLRRWLFNGFLQQPAPGLSLHSQKQQCSPGRPQPEHFTNLTVCTCVCEDVHTSSFETGRLESEAGNRNHARWEGGGCLIITGLCEHMNMCLCGKEKLPNCIRRFQLHSSVWTSQQGNHRVGILLENHAHIQKPSQNFLSFKLYVPPQHDFRFLLVRAKDSDYIKGNYEQETGCGLSRAGGVEHTQNRK